MTPSPSLQVQVDTPLFQGADMGSLSIWCIYARTPHSPPHIIYSTPLTIKKLQPCIAAVNAPGIIKGKATAGYSDVEVTASSIKEYKSGLFPRVFQYNTFMDKIKL